MKIELLYWTFTVFLYLILTVNSRCDTHNWLSSWWNTLCPYKTRRLSIYFVLRLRSNFIDSVLGKSLQYSGNTTTTTSRRIQDKKKSPVIPQPFDTYCAWAEYIALFKEPLILWSKATWRWWCHDKSYNLNLFPWKQ